MRRRADAEPRDDEPSVHVRRQIEYARQRFGADHEGFEQWVEGYRDSGWRNPPVRRLYIVDRDD